ncbi:MAG: hypothetical protein Fues2KO_38560 [Fuerstiella sp.]
MPEARHSVTDTVFPVAIRSLNYEKPASSHRITTDGWYFASVQLGDGSIFFETFGHETG